MAKKKQQATNGQRSEKGVAPPEGFDINVERARGDGWVTKQTGNEVCGRILGRHTFTGKNGKKRAYYQIKLARPCFAEVMPEDADEDAEAITTKLEPGAVVNVDEIKKLEDLEPFVSNGGIYDVWFVFDRQIDVGQPSPMWNVKGPRLKMVKKPAELPQQEETPAIDDNIPF